MKHLKIKCLIAILASFFVGVFVHSETTFALVDNTNYNSPVIQKALLTSLYGCYAGGQVDGVVEKLSGFNNFANLVEDDKNKKVALPTGLTPIKETDQRITCRGLIAGDGLGSGLKGTFEGLLPETASKSLSGKSGKATIQNDKINLLVGMGYKDVGYTDSNGNKFDQDKPCVTFNLNETTSGGVTKEITTDKVCANIGSDNKIESLEVDTTTGTYSIKQVNQGHSAAVVGIPFFSVMNGKIHFYRATVNNGYTTTYKTTDKGVGDTWDDFLEDFRGKLSGLCNPNTGGFTYSAGGYYGGYTYTSIGGSLENDENDDEHGDSRYEFISGGFQYAALRAGFQGISYLSTNGTTYSTFSDLSFSREERLEYYIKVMQEFYFDGADPRSYWVCNVADYSYYGSGFDTDINIDWADPGKNKNCKLDKSKMNSANIGQSYNSFGTQWGVDHIFGVTVGTFDSLLDNLNTIATWYPKDDEIVDESDVQGPVDDSGNSLPGGGHLGINDLCLSHDDAASVAWIACPAVDGMAQGNDGIYGWIKDMLVVKSELLSSDSASYEIWSKFRDAANIIFIAVMLIVIFSQVTGFGIDNYGIKKILPRLIVTAVLVNLSFIICQGAVDFSNIIGSSLSLWLSSIAVNTGPGVHTGVGFVSILEAILGGGGAVTAGGASFGITIATIAGEAAGWWIILVVLAIVLVIALIAILVVFLMLGARQLIVIAAVALAPLAIICYTLPNTEKLFKRWLDIFKAALVMFPICSALAGMGQIIQAIVYGSDVKLGMAVALLAAACPFLPFLALPTLLKSSLKAVADLGGKLSGLRNKVTNAGRSINSSLRNTDAYKDAQFQTAMARNTRRLSKLSATPDSELSEWQKRRKSLYQRRDLAFREEAYKRDMTDDDFAARLKAQESMFNKQALDNEVALMADETGNYEIGAMNSQLKSLLAQETLSEKDEIRMKALMYKMAQGGGFNKKELAKTLGGEKVSSTARAAAAKFMSKNSEVASAVNGKDLAMGQYLREVNIAAVQDRQAGRSIGAEDSAVTQIGSFETWASAQRMENGVPTGMTNMQFVTSKVATKPEDFVGQSSSAVEASIGTLSTEYLSRLVQNERVMDLADNDVISAVVAEAQSRGLSVPGKYLEVMASEGAEPVTPIIEGAANTTSTSTSVRAEAMEQFNIPHPTPHVQPVQPIIQTSPAPQQPLTQPNPQAQQATHDQVVEEMKNMPRK